MLYTEGDTDFQHSDAHKIMELLTAAYPGHPWAVRVAGGMIFIRYLDQRLSGNWGMAMKQKDTQHDAAVLKRDVIRMAGEWLERSGLKRGVSNGDKIEDVDGVPLKYKPKPYEGEVVIAESEQPLRTEPMPQAMRNGN